MLLVRVDLSLVLVFILISISLIFRLFITFQMEADRLNYKNDKIWSKFTVLLQEILIILLFVRKGVVLLEGRWIQVSFLATIKV